MPDDWEKCREYLKAREYSDEEERECYIDIGPETSIVFENMLQIQMNFSGSENKLWQLSSFIKSIDLFHLPTFLHLKEWAKLRKIPCELRFLVPFGVKWITLKILVWWFSLSPVRELTDIGKINQDE